MQTDTNMQLKSIDFLVIDEIYKLETDVENDRVLVLNMAYYRLSKIAKKYVLLAPFLKGIEDLEVLEKKPAFYHSDYSPVVNEVKVCEIAHDRDRESECNEIDRMLPGDQKTLIYFPNVSGLNKYIREIISNLPDVPIVNPAVRGFLSWAKEEIHENWSIVRAMEKGFLVHNGQIPRGVRQFQLDQYENSKTFNRMLCTSTLLEGVNTSARNIIITKASRGARSEKDSNFTAFDFFNLVGRTGRLNQHLIGTAYYIKGPKDNDYKNEDAIRTIRFEVTDNSTDIDIHTNNLGERPEVTTFLKSLNISLDEYIENIGSRYRFETVKRIYENYTQKKDELIDELNACLEEPKRGRYHLIHLLLSICEHKSNKLDASIIANLVNLRRPKLRHVIEKTAKHYNKVSLDFIIASTIKMKYSELEHKFYGKTKIVEYFLLLDKTDERLIEKLNDKIIRPIEILYYISSPAKKMMSDLGIYERDIDRLCCIIGDEFTNARDLIDLLRINREKFSKLSYMSRFVIDKLIA